MASYKQITRMLHDEGLDLLCILITLDESVAAFKDLLKRATKANNKVLISRYTLAIDSATKASENVRLAAEELLDKLNKV